MAVLIKGLNKPQSCGDCWFWEHCDRWRNRNWGASPPDDCPLVPVPPHGDLIDRSVLYKETAEWEEQARHLANTAPDARTFDKWATILTERSAFKFDVADAPTIIPAEGATHKDGGGGTMADCRHCDWRRVMAWMYDLHWQGAEDCPMECGGAKGTNVPTKIEPPKEETE